MNTFALLLLALVAAVATAKSLRKEIKASKKAVEKIDHATELKLFEEEVRAMTFDKYYGVFKHKQQAKKTKSPLIPMSGTTFDADGKPLITTKSVASGSAEEYLNAWTSTKGATSCDDADLDEVTSTPLDTCVAIYNYDHSSSTGSSFSAQASYSGDGPYEVTIKVYSDTGCSTMVGSSNSEYSTSCEKAGSGDNKCYGYASVTTSVMTSAPAADGAMEIGYDSKGCSGDATMSEWVSLESKSGVSAFGECTEFLGVYAKFECNGGTATYAVYEDKSCSKAYDDDSTSGTVLKKGVCETSTQDDDASYGSDDYTSLTMYYEAYCTTSASETATCFAGSEMVSLESGVSKPIADVVVGDRVLAANGQGALVYSDVIAVPHAKNNDRVMFNEISLANGADIRMTGEHLLPVAASCGVNAVFALTSAKDVVSDLCVMTVDGQSAVVSNNKVAGSGIYTIVTGEEYVVVNGVVASPFATSHAMGNTFYNVYRAMYNYVPGLFKSRVFQSFHSTFATLAMKTW